MHSATIGGNQHALSEHPRQSACREAISMHSATPLTSSLTERPHIASAAARDTSSEL